jgi:hypothetical protein
MRKTFGYWQFMSHSGNASVLSMLQRLFGHSSQAMTLRYIGISREDDKRLYNDVNLRTIAFAVETSAFAVEKSAFAVETSDKRAINER